jgi:hypothetical protein
VSRKFAHDNKDRYLPAEVLNSFVTS